MSLNSVKIGGLRFANPPYKLQAYKSALRNLMQIFNILSGCSFVGGISEA
jgi:hypothetical protein